MYVGETHIYVCMQQVLIIICVDYEIRKGERDKCNISTSENYTKQSSRSCMRLIDRFSQGKMRKFLKGKSFHHFVFPHA